ncbi:MAG: helix-turn-helix transcriptional regulator [Clostridiales bacterium]|nr:helix-turn-helix transcriptional regulator [Clostridiales bacterium]
MDYSILEVASRLKGLRESAMISEGDFANRLGISEQEYISYESGEKDFPLTFLYKCASEFGVDLIELLTGVTPKLKSYSIIRKGKGLAVERRERFAYQHLAYLFKGRKMEPLMVTAPYEEDAQDKPIKLSTHEGQELDLVIKGQLKVVIGERTEVLKEGDAIYYDSSTKHGMIATGGEDCEFLAILIK